MADVRYTRRFRLGDRGPDVEGVGRALARYHKRLLAFQAQPRWMRRRWGKRKQDWLREFKRKHGLPADGIYGEGAHTKLSPYFDARARALMLAYEAPHAEQDAKFAKLLAVMKEMSAKTPGYQLGGGHGVPLSDVRYDQKLDCSSSTSKALYDAHMFDDRYAWVSGRFATSYGKPGKGTYFTVYGHDGHVWIRLHRSRWWRFDTSPYGESSGAGPRLRYLPRLTTGFRARHWKGM